MKKITLITLIFITTKLSTNAQEFKSCLYLYGGLKVLDPYGLHPDLGIGYLKNLNNGNRQNLVGNFGFGLISFTTNLKYSYDFKAIQKKRFAFYISPYLQANSTFSRISSTYFPSISLQIGLQPSLEYKISKNVHLTASLPIKLWGVDYYTQNIGGSQFRANSNLNSHLNVGVRVNLLNIKNSKLKLTNSNKNLK
jgi:hypothetical protein